MAGDRRATRGQPRSATARWRRCSRPTASAVSPSPAPPGPAMEMVKLFQLQLEHYEKVEGTVAQPRGQGQPARRRWCAATCPPPCRASSSCRSSPATTQRRGDGPALQLRRHRRPLRGAATTWPPARAASTPAPSIKVGFRRGHDRDDAVDLVRPGAVRGRRRGLRHRRARPRPRHLSRPSPRSPPTATSAVDGDASELRPRVLEAIAARR